MKKLIFSVLLLCAILSSLAQVKVFFPSNNASALSNSPLRELADSVRHAPGAMINIIGYTDSVGSEESNSALGQRRAESIKAALVAMGVPGKMIEASSEGEGSPIADNNSAQGRSMNRRADPPAQHPFGPKKISLSFCRRPDALVK